MRLLFLVLLFIWCCFTVGISFCNDSQKQTTTIEEIVEKHMTNFSKASNPESLCKACNLVFDIVLEASDKNVPKFLIETTFINVCHLVLDKTVCKGLLEPNLDILFYILKSGKDVDSKKICTLALDCHNDLDYFNWTIDIPEKSQRIPDKVSNKASRNYRVLHLTDLHLDPRYTPGSTTNCGEFLCCQDDQGPPETPEESCGVWGSYTSSDIPKKTFYDALRHMKTQKDIDYVYFTGDIISHRVWSTSKANNLNLEHEVMELLRNSFDNVPVLFVLGNHEPHPLNSYGPLNVTKDQLSTKWIFDNLAEELNNLGIDDENMNNIEQGGFYTITPKTGFRIIVLNNNICNKLDFWLLYDDYDVYGQLKWLIKTLLQAEKAGEYVHLLYHIPSGDKDCLTSWAREFTRIINRFSDTITAQFNGHTHRDSFYLFFNESNPDEAISVAHNGASMTTYSDINPSYKIYDISYENYEVVESEEWTFNLTAANLMPEKTTLDWYKLYSFRETYGVETMKPKVLGKMVFEMAKNKSLLQTHYRIMYRMGNKINSFCGDECNEKNLCDIVTSHAGDTEHCENIKKIYEGAT